MARIKIEDLPVLEELETKQTKGIFGGASYLKLPDIDGESTTSDFDLTLKDDGSSAESDDSDEPGLAGVTVYLDGSLKG